MTRNQHIVERFMERIWAEGDEGTISDMVDPNATVYGLEEVPLHGSFDILRFRRMVHAQFSEFGFRVIHTVDTDDKISVSGKVMATDLQTGRRGGARIQMMMQINDDRIILADILLDYIEFFESMGRLPPRILDQCLLGSPIGWTSQSVRQHSG